MFLFVANYLKDSPVVDNEKNEKKHGRSRCPGRPIDAIMQDDEIDAIIDEAILEATENS